MDHEEIRQSIAALAIDALDDEQGARVEHELVEHLPGCPSCLALVRDLREVAGDLAFATGVSEPPAGLEARVLAAVDADRQPAPAGPRGRAVLRVGAVVAAVAVLASWTVSGVLYVHARNAERTADAAAGTALALAVMGDSSTRTAVLHGAAGVVLVGVRADGTVALIADDVASPQSGSRFELWLIRAGVPTPVRTFTPVGGRFALVATVDPASYAEVAITAERSFVRAPTAAPVYSGSLSG